MTTKIIPVVIIDSADKTDGILSQLYAGGIGIAEITMRTDCALEALRLGVKNHTQMLIGAGTVTTAEQCRAALGEGARFIVSPGLSESVAKLCLAQNVPYYPGCVTPTEIMRAMDLGLGVVKFFPANVYGGLEAIKALSAPFSKVKFIPTGGIDAENLRPYLINDKVFAVGGSWMLKGDIARHCGVIDEILKTVQQ